MLHEGSTGKIMLQIARLARKNNHEVRTFSPIGFAVRRKLIHPDIPGHTYYGSWLSRGIHTVLGMFAGANGLCSVLATRRLLLELDKFAPDVLHLHNLHQYCVNLPMLFQYIKKNRIRTVWTLHDCWTFTGHCPHFDYIGCEKWRTGCHDCPLLKEYPRSYVDHTKWMYNYKKKWFAGVENMVLVTPSQWLADLVRQSFLGEYPVKVIYNGIDLDIFQPTESDFRKKYGCENKIILLGVAFEWGHRKGLDVFAELAGRLDDSYQIVLVGTDKIVEQQLPENIIAIRRTNGQRELAEIYTAADLLVNPTREEVLGLVNVEALACGTPVITFRTGGSPECVDGSCGVVVDRDDITELEHKIKEICETSPFTQENCMLKARTFSMYDRFEEYVRLYEN